MRDGLHPAMKGEADLCSCSTFDEYQQELESGLLRWSTPTHQDEDFWRENAKKLESDNKRCVKCVPVEGQGGLMLMVNRL